MINFEKNFHAKNDIAWKKTRASKIEESQNIIIDFRGGFSIQGIKKFFGRENFFLVSFD